MSSDDLAEFYIHTVAAEPVLGSSSHGPVYGDPVDVPCFVASGTRMVRTTSGDEVVSTAQITAAPDAADAFPPGARVTLPWGAVTKVINTHRADSGDLDLPDHVEAVCE